MDGYSLIKLIITGYFIGHSPAFLMLLIGAFIRREHPDTAKKFFTAATVYFLIGGGVCGVLITMLL